MIYRLLPLDFQDLKLRVTTISFDWYCGYPSPIMNLSELENFSWKSHYKINDMFRWCLYKRIYKINFKYKNFLGGHGHPPPVPPAHHLPVSIKENTFLQSSFHLDVDFLQILFIHVRCWRHFFYYLKNFVILWLWGWNFFFSIIFGYKKGVCHLLFFRHCFKVRKLSNF